MNIKPPTFDITKDNVNEYFRQVEKYKTSINKQKYIIALDFINALLKLEHNNKLNSLLSFKNIDEKYLSHNDEIINEYIPKLKTVFTIASIDTPIDLIKCIVKQLDYKLKYKSKGKNSKIYSITK